MFQFKIKDKQGVNFVSYSPTLADLDTSLKRLRKASDAEFEELADRLPHLLSRAGVIVYSDESEIGEPWLVRAADEPDAAAWRKFCQASLLIEKALDNEFSAIVADAGTAPLDAEEFEHWHKQRAQRLLEVEAARAKVRSFYNAKLRSLQQALEAKQAAREAESRAREREAENSIETRVARLEEQLRRRGRTSAP